ncbi:MAG: DUF1217 domain-containing protein [Silicimonas sp.]|nr:DUF1217 domain-containing protein [Silicimonas sp.]
MSYQPILPMGGNLGWSFLKNTREAQQDAFDNSTAVKKNTDYFAENIGKITSAEELVADRRLLTVALGAFGLSEDIDNKFYIKKVLEEGTLDPESFANRLADKRYFAMAEAFGFELSPPNSAISTFPDQIISEYKNREFEVAVGNQDGDMRLALGIEREMAELAERNLTEDAAWFTIMGTPPMRNVFETALGLPKQMAAVDIDQQLEVFKEKSSQVFGTENPADFTDPELQEKLVRNFLFRAELDAAASQSQRGTVALSLLQSQAPLF